MATPTPVQNWITRYLIAVDNNGSPTVYLNTVKPRGGLLGAIEYLQSLVAEGVSRQFIPAYGSNTPFTVADADLVAVGPPLIQTAAAFLTLVQTLQAINAQLGANGAAALLELYNVRSQ